MKLKFLSFLTLVIIATMLLTACGGPAPAATQPPAAPATKAPPPPPTEAPPPPPTVAPPPPATEVPTEAPVGPQKGGELVWAETGGYYTLDPYVTPWHAIPQFAVYDSLLALKPDLSTYVGYLVEDGWKVSDDNTTLTFTVKKNIKFTDGTPVTAKALKEVYDVYLDEKLGSPGGGDLRDNVKEFQAPDDNTLVLVLKQPYAPIYSVLTAEVPSPTAYKTLGGDKFASTPVGSGQWKVKEITPDVSILYERNEDYNWGPAWYDNKGAAYPDTFLIKYFSDNAVMYSSFEAGEVQVATIPPEFLAKARENKNITIVEGQDTGSTYLGFNCEYKPFDNKNVRVAISYAINRDELIQVGLSGEGIPVYTNLVPAEMGYSPEVEAYAKERSDNVDKANEMLAAEGYTMGSDNVLVDKDGKKMEFILTTTPDDTRKRVAETIQAQLAEIGIKATIELKETQVVKEMTQKSTHQMILWGYAMLDPSILTYLYSSTRLGASNRTRINDPELDKLLVAADQELNWDKRKENVAAAVTYLVDLRNMIPLFATKYYYAYRNDMVGGMKFDKLGNPLFNDAYMLKK